LKSLSNQQRLHQVNTEQLYENYRAAQNHAASYTYGMRWKTVRGCEYLFRDRDRRGNGKSFGPRSEQTEELFAVFSAGRIAAKERFNLITEKIQEQARLNKALRLNRVPRVVARVLRELERAGVHDSFTVIGTQPKAKNLRFQYLRWFVMLSGLARQNHCLNVFEPVR